jgi:hypothetical protein
MGPAIEAGLILSAEASNVYMRRLLAAWQPRELEWAGQSERIKRRWHRSQ